MSKESFLAADLDESDSDDSDFAPDPDSDDENGELPRRFSSSKDLLSGSPSGLHMN